MFPIISLSPGMLTSKSFIDLEFLRHLGYWIILRANSKKIQARRSKMAVQKN